MHSSSPPSLQTLLQTALLSVQWTYSLFWQLCPQQRVLVWRDGYYNGSIKTRKTVLAAAADSTEVSAADDASLHRSGLIRELYESLSAAAGEYSNGGQQVVPAVVRRPSAALSPEDLTESEWFYLMCMSFSFPPGYGLPGKAYAMQQHIWLTGANEVHSNVFSRAILAKIRFGYHISTEITRTNVLAALSLSSGSSPGCHDLFGVEDLLLHVDRNLLHAREAPGRDGNALHQQAPPVQEIAQQDNMRYFETTISTILGRHQPPEISTTTARGVFTVISATSAFSKWRPRSIPTSVHFECRSIQWSLKYILLTVPLLHAKNSSNRAGPPEICGPSAAQEEPNANHVLAERRRREKLNERFVVLRSLVPFVTKTDKASVLGDTINYVKHLHERVQELESMAENVRSGVDRRSIPSARTSGVHYNRIDQRSIHHAHISGVLRFGIGSQPIPEKDGAHVGIDRLSIPCVQRGGVHKIETGRGDDAGMRAGAVEVSIIERDGLVELRCSYRKGLLLEVMKILGELGLEITAVQSSINGRILFAELRAKIKENSRGGRASIMEVKKAINRIIPRQS
ncbi:unnamed protein product [Cuscuta campestris]|uniref:BHLH domain-containing protein n=1 Tax=Cuscuta campestris TaxID=132261 RepID=A0A484NP28_9ASTE|nr:unnamed protein product [Cuscuta campestris]